jgi:hypothetical protein
MIGKFFINVIADRETVKQPLSNKRLLRNERSQ